MYECNMFRKSLGYAIVNVTYAEGNVPTTLQPTIVQYHNTILFLYYHFAIFNKTSIFLHLLSNLWNFVLLLCI